MVQLCFLTNVSGEQWAAWAQAFLSGVAILASGLLMNYQHKLERRRDAEVDAERRRQHVESAFQLVGAVHQVCQKIEKWAGTTVPHNWECSDDLDSMADELEGLSDALRQVDYGRFDQHLPIEASLVALSAARRLIRRIQANPFGHPVSDQEGLTILVDAARESRREIRTRLDKFCDLYPTYHVKA